MDICPIIRPHLAADVKESVPRLVAEPLHVDPTVAQELFELAVPKGVESRVIRPYMVIMMDSSLLYPSEPLEVTKMRHLANISRLGLERAIEERELSRPRLALRSLEVWLAPALDMRLRDPDETEGISLLVAVAGRWE